MLNPKSIRLDRYGQIKGRPRSIADRANTSAGVVQTKAGPVWGFWQRLKGKKGGPRLKLLARAGEALTVKKRLGFDARARALVAKGWWSRVLGSPGGSAEIGTVNIGSKRPGQWQLDGKFRLSEAPDHVAAIYGYVAGISVPFASTQPKQQQDAQLLRSLAG